MDKQQAGYAGCCPELQTQACKLPLASPCTLAAPVVAEQQPLQRHGQGRWTAASGVLPIWCLMVLQQLTLRTPWLCLPRILNSAVAGCLGAGGSASGVTNEYHRHCASSIYNEYSGAASPRHSPSTCLICCRLF